MQEKMSLTARRELLGRIGERYRLAPFREKTQILNQFITTTGYTRKHAICLLNMREVPKRKPVRRSARYDDRVRQALVTLWEAANRICAKRLVPFLSELIPTLERFGHLSLPDDVRERLLTISAATADRVLAPERQRQGRGWSTTKPGNLLKQQIRVRTFADWDDLQPGFFEADLVAHCGDSVHGTFLNTLVLVDVTTGWTECLALLRKSDADVIGGLDAAQKQLPFPLLGLDTDNGSEFINYELFNYCRDKQVCFTRGRAYRKNDQAHVEEKNGSVVRRLVGYDRYEGVEAWRALTELYSVLRWYQNFFQPSMKLLSKQRLGSQVRKRYDRAKTPYQRILLSETVSKEQKAKLEQKRPTLDPIVLLREIERLQEQFWKFANVETERRGDRDELNELVPSLAQELDMSQEVTTAVASEPSKIHVRRYRRTKKPRAPRTWRTRKDPFAEVWSELRLQLELHPALAAKDLFLELQERYPGKFEHGQLRTLQRRVRDWRLHQLYRQEILQQSVKCCDSGPKHPVTTS